MNPMALALIAAIALIVVDGIYHHGFSHIRGAFRTVQALLRGRHISPSGTATAVDQTHKVCPTCKRSMRGIFFPVSTEEQERRYLRDDSEEALW